MGIRYDDILMTIDVRKGRLRAELVNVFEMVRVLPFHSHCVFSGFCQRPVLIT